jgi:hypothetical protein
MIVQEVDHGLQPCMQVTLFSSKINSPVAARWLVDRCAKPTLWSLVNQVHVIVGASTPPSRLGSRLPTATTP